MRLSSFPLHVPHLRAIRTVDSLAILITGIISAATIFEHENSLLGTPGFALATVFATVANLLALGWGAAGITAGRGRRLHRWLGFAGPALIALLIADASREATPQMIAIWLASWISSGSAAVMLLHSYAFQRPSEAGTSRNVVTIGDALLMAPHLQRLKTMPGTRLVASFGSSTREQSAPIADADDILGALAQFRNWSEVDEVHLIFPYAELATVFRIRQTLRRLPVRITWLHDESAAASAPEYRQLPRGMTDLSQPEAHGFQGALKALFDKSVATAAVILLLPLLAVIAVSIKSTSRGPIIFKQRRLGLNGTPFHIYKFRTMKLHAEQGCVTQARRNDPRLTCIGAFLRRTSLDELPQFFNVLRGDMSVVGPRPHAIEHNELYQDQVAFYMLRHRVKPGITGLAQINGYRGETDKLEKMAKRVEYDLRYIGSWSIVLDVQIFMQTLIKGWVSRNSY